jgi:hypothetical protein
VQQWFLRSTAFFIGFFYASWSVGASVQSGRNKLQAINMNQRKTASAIAWLLATMLTILGTAGYCADTALAYIAALLGTLRMRRGVQQHRGHC